jgi:hypothetical protein
MEGFISGEAHYEVDNTHVAPVGTMLSSPQHSARAYASRHSTTCGIAMLIRCYEPNNTSSDGCIGDACSICFVRRHALAASSKFDVHSLCGCSNGIWCVRARVRSC